MPEHLKIRPTKGNGILNWVLLSFLILVIFISNWFWVKLDTRPPHWDASAHLRISLTYLDVLISPDRRWEDLLNVESYYPPFYHLSLIPFLIGFGAYADNAVWVNGCYMAVILVSTFSIGKRLFDRGTGLVAALLIGCYPYLNDVSKYCLIDTALTAFVPLSYYYFIRSKNFNDSWFTFLFSIVSSFGMLVKWTFIFFMIPTLFIGLFSKQKPGWRQASLRVKSTNFLMLFGTPALICFPWYAHNLGKMVKSGIKHAGAGTMEGDPTHGWDMWLYYFRTIEMQTGLWLFILFIIAIVLFLICKNFFNPTLLFWIVVPYLILTFINNKDPRYTLPFLPAVAVISARPIFLIKKIMIRYMTLGLVATVSVMTFALGGFSNQNWRMISLPILGQISLNKARPPKKETWPIKKILKDIIDESGSVKENPIIVRTLTNHASFHRGAFQEIVQANDLPVTMKTVKRNLGEFTDFFITKGSGAGWERGGRPKRINRLRNDPALTQTFPEFRRYDLPDGSQGVIYRRKVHPANDLHGVNNLLLMEKRLSNAFAKYPQYGISQRKNFKLKIFPTNNPEDLYFGKYNRIIIEADSAIISKIRVHNLYLILEDIQINLYELIMNSRLIFFKIGQLIPQITLRFEDVEKRMAMKLGNKLRTPFRLEGKKNTVIHATFELREPAISFLIQAGLDFKPGNFVRPVVDSIQVGPFTVPKIFYRVFLNQRLTLKPTSGWPLVTEIQSIKVLNRQIIINPSYSIS